MRSTTGAVTTDPALLEGLRGVLDPEIGVSVVDLGLVYGVWREGDVARVVMTMTTPACPLGGVIAAEARATLMGRFADLRDVEVDVVFDPPWDPSRMTDAGRARLGW